MSSAPTSKIDIPTLSIDAARRIDEACDRWEGAWLAGKPDPLQDYLATFEETLRPALLRQLLLLEWEYLCQRGERVEVAEYQARFPQYSTLIQEAITEHSLAMAPSLEPLADTVFLSSSRASYATKDWEELGYVILNQLDCGMGTVFLARHMATDRLVAVKVLRGADAFDPGGLERFRREVQSLARLQHPHIVPVYDVGQFQGRPFYSMEYCSGGSLAEHLRQNRLTPHDAAELVETLARAVHAAHQAQIIHRDLKPSNVLLQKNAAPQNAEPTNGTSATHFTPKLADFGLAKTLDAVTQTQTGLVIGTPQYMAPEQARGDSKGVGVGADIYALGAILYECLAGRPPFRGATLWDTLQQVMSAEAASFRYLHPYVPRDLETICLKCLRKDPRERYANAAALAEDLRRFRAGQPILVRPAGAMERTWKWAKRYPAAAALLGVLILGGVVGPTLVALALAERGAAIEALAKAADENARTERQVAQRMYAQALVVGDQGDAASALLWLAYGLRAAVRAGDNDLESSIRLQLEAWQQALPSACFVAHQSHLFAVAFSSDGTKVAIAGADHEARLWDTATCRQLGPPLRHQDTVFAVAFSPDGTLVLTGSADHTARLWDTATGTPCGPPLVHQNRVLAVQFSPDGKTVLTGSHDGTARLWETHGGKPKVVPLEHQGIIRSVAFSPDGNTIATGGDDAMARFWETTTGKPVGTPLQCKEKVFAVAFSPDGKTVLTGSRDTGQLWNSATGKPVGPPLQHEDWVMAVDFSPDGKTVLTASVDRTVRLCYADTGEPLGQVLQHSDEVRAAVFSPNGEIVLTGCWDHKARLWDVVPPIRLRNKAVRAAAFSPDSKTVLTGSWDYSARLWSVATGEPSGPRMEHRDVVLAVAFSPDGKTVLTGCRDATAQVWDAATGKPLGPPLKHQRDVAAVAYSPDGKRVLTGSYDFTAQMWDAATGKRLSPPFTHRESVGAVAFSPDGQKVLTGAWDYTVRAWDASTGKPMGLLAQHSDSVEAIAVSPNGKSILTGSRDGTVRLWDAATGNPVSPILQHRKHISSVALSPEGQIALSGSDDNTACLWDLATGKRLGLPLVHPGPVEAVAFSPDGKNFLTGHQNGTARLWTIAPPMHGDSQWILRWSQVLTGMEIDERGALRPLDAATWTQRREAIEVYPKTSS